MYYYYYEYILLFINMPKDENICFYAEKQKCNSMKPNKKYKIYLYSFLGNK